MAVHLYFTDSMFFSISITSALFAGTILGLAGLVIYVFLRCLLSFTHHAKEPLAVATEIPYLSPMIGMAKKAQFYIDLEYVDGNETRLFVMC